MRLKRNQNVVSISREMASTDKTVVSFLSLHRGNLRTTLTSNAEWLQGTGPEWRTQKTRVYSRLWVRLCNQATVGQAAKTDRLDPVLHRGDNILKSYLDLLDHTIHLGFKHHIGHSIDRRSTCKQTQRDTNKLSLIYIIHSDRFKNIWAWAILLACCHHNEHSRVGPLKSFRLTWPREGIRKSKGIRMHRVISNG